MIQNPLNSNNDEYIKIHYHRDDANYENWCLWLWGLPNGIGDQYPFNGVDDFGAFAIYPLSKFSSTGNIKILGLIVKHKDNWEVRDGKFDRRVILSKIEKDSDGIINIFLRENDPEIYANENYRFIDSVRDAKFIDFSTISLTFNNKVESFKILENDEVLIEKSLRNTDKSIIIRLPKDKKISIENRYKVELKTEGSKVVEREFISTRELFKTEEFKNLYNYSGELGAIYSKKSTTFKVWSPVSKEIKLRLYKNGTPVEVDDKHGSDKIYKEVEMVKGKNGVFSATIKKNLEGYYYTYVVTNPIYKNREVVDPYARSAGVDGKRGMIVDFSKTNPNGFEDIKIHSINPLHLTVYETHIQDLTSSSTWSQNPKHKHYAKTFAGACLEGTTYEENGVCVSTGFDHIKELGVNAVQLLPIFDQANDEIKQTYNWGYNPLNYNVLEGAYSSNPYDGYARIIEFKNLVKKYHDAGINIIMDVVLNHVNGATGSNFDVLMPGYYFRYINDGLLSNGSGCGNETASEMFMMRKFMIDSVLFWAKEYKIGGFRFDLMGLHDLETMNLLTSELKKFCKDIVVYGEPWCGGGSALPYQEASIQCNISKFQEYGGFNDKIRESALYWAMKTDEEIDDCNLHNIKSAIVGSLDDNNEQLSDPITIVNYLSCHDNFTLKDKLINYGINDEKQIRKISLLGNSIIFTSNGISFMLAGEEFLRSKGGCGNSYNAPYEVNALDYSLKIKNKQLVECYKKLIKFKQEVSDLANIKGKNLNTKIDVSLKKNIISYELKDAIKGRTYKVVHANGYDERSLGSVNLMDYKLYFDSLDPNKKLSTYTKVNPYETIIAYKE